MVYRERGDTLQVLLVHPGGPFWSNKDRGAWSIPKGEVQQGEDLLCCARREAREELGTQFAVEGPFIELTPARQKQKIVYAWAVKGDLDTDAIASNTFTIEYPPRSGRSQTFPEVDEAQWFEIADAHEKIIAGQSALLDQLINLVGASVRYP